MAVKFAPNVENFLYVGRRHGRHARSDEEKALSHALKHRMRRSRSLSSERTAEAARERAVHLERQARKYYRHPPLRVGLTPSAQEDTISEDCDSPKASPGRCSWCTTGAGAVDDFRSSDVESSSALASNSHESVSFHDCKEPSPTVPWTRRFFISSRALLDRVKLIGHGARRSHIAVVPACVESPNAVVSSQEDEHGSRGEQETEPQLIKAFSAENRPSRLPWGMLRSRAVHHEGARSDAHFAFSTTSEESASGFQSW
eukprot:TRINITY_DN11149_c0_g2_i1.p1 TRINITY_DN11149_c0_g2~~TRINITY_DN11149_c0_g2_i1.p1  ORF type:complete len:281 (+),score=9.72 TRINITY_DN11149_c0_g2_i1:72-845(+)